jgi:hypothetical protein
MFIIDCFHHQLSPYVQRTIRGAIVQENNFLIFDSKFGNSASIEYKISGYRFEIISISTIEDEISVKLNNQEGKRVDNTIFFENKPEDQTDFITFTFENRSEFPLKYYFRCEVIGFFSKNFTNVYNLRHYLIDELVLYNLKFKNFFVKKFEDRKNFTNTVNLNLLCKDRFRESIIPVFIDKWFRFLYPTEFYYAKIGEYSLFSYNMRKEKLQDIIYFCLITTDNNDILIESVFCTKIDIDVIFNLKYEKILLDIKRDIFYHFGNILGIKNEIKKINYFDQNVLNQGVKLITKTIKNIRSFRDTEAKIKIFPPYGILRYRTERPITNLTIDIEVKEGKVDIVFFADGLEQEFPDKTPLQKLEKYFEIRFFVKKVTKIGLRKLKIKYMN